MLQSSTAITAGAVLLTVVAVAYGGTFMLRVVSGKQPTNALQKSMFRAGHAHAGVLIILGLLVALFIDGAGVGVWGRVASDGVLACAILIPGGFFFSAIGHDPKRPNRWIALVWVGFAVLSISLVIAGIGLIAAGAGAS